MRKQKFQVRSANSLYCLCISSYYRLNIMGINTAEEFNERLNAEILRKNEHKEENES